jgi:dihydrofolate reductase
VSRRVALFIATSLDGYIAGPDGDLSWRFHDADCGYAAVPGARRHGAHGAAHVRSRARAARVAHAGRKTVVFSRRGELVVASPDTVATARPRAT